MRSHGTGTRSGGGGGPDRGDGDLTVLGRSVGQSAFPVFNNQGDYTPITTEIPLESAPKPEFPNGYVQTGSEDQIYAHEYVLLTLAVESASTLTESPWLSSCEAVALLLVSASVFQ